MINRRVNHISHKHMNRTHPALFPKGFKDAHKSHKLHKKYKLEIYEKVKQNKTGAKFTPQRLIYIGGEHGKPLALSIVVSSKKTECSLLTQFSQFHESKSQIHPQMPGNIKSRIKFPLWSSQWQPYFSQKDGIHRVLFPQSLPTASQS